jgi:hypothetical protein
MKTKEGLGAFDTKGADFRETERGWSVALAIEVLQVLWTGSGRLAKL